MDRAGIAAVLSRFLAEAQFGNDSRLHMTARVAMGEASDADDDAGQPSPMLPSVQRLVGWLLDVVMFVVIRGPMESDLWSTVWADRIRVAGMQLVPFVAPQDISEHRTFHESVHHMGLSNTTKDVVLDLSPISVAWRAVLVVFSKVGIPVVVPARFRSVEQAGQFEGYPNGPLVRMQVVAQGYGETSDQVVFGANVGHEIHEIHGPMQSMLLDRSHVALTSADWSQPGSLMQSAFECLRQKMALGGIVVPDDIGVADIHKVGPLVLGRRMDGSAIFPRSVDTMTPMVAEASLAPYFADFDVVRHAFAIHAFAPSVLGVLAKAVARRAVAGVGEQNEMTSKVAASHILKWYVDDYARRHPVGGQQQQPVPVGQPSTAPAVGSVVAVDNQGPIFLVDRRVVGEGNVAGNGRGESP